jgi:hypothetical protein
MKKRMSQFTFWTGVLLVIGAILVACTAPVGVPETGSTQVVEATATQAMLEETATAEPLPEDTEEPAPTADPTAAEPGPMVEGDPVRGGLLYDDWMTVVGVDPPSSDHPLWKTQTTNTRTGKDTWRCKECHLGLQGRRGRLRLRLASDGFQRHF